ncbi:winged helix-turn-helix domain-containing protein [Sphingomonas sabuli]|uniref:Winged helix-turn-helix domain-containing protein n=1 Tax=Sphingomonas sabuli TaxID=2764186 RepID=A0A7G9L259_9SPHN|nr:winged helix-turn-helix domain-containing protein [Sphingomonas sabuli]QNM82708.1 winged helix-turn-helix domain-containing protein [Sphingomonas sabuli]
MASSKDFASRPDFDVGPLSVSPARRRVSGPGGDVQLEPVIMQVFLLLLGSGGRVVTRNELFDHVWGGVIVGDDSLNRAIAKVRRIAAQVAPGSFEIETIPRTGYRLTGTLADEIADAPTQSDEPSSFLRNPSRRTLVGAAAVAGAAALAGGGWWWATRSSPSGFDEIMARGDRAMAEGTAFERASVGANDSPEMVRLYRQAVRLNPDSARAWGLLAYFSSISPDVISAALGTERVKTAELSVQRALALDPHEPYARLALYLLQGAMVGWAERDRQLRGIIDSDPNCIPAMMELMALLQAAGLTRESWQWNERLLKQSPFLRPSLVARALKLWIMGKDREADAVISRVVGLWPDYPFGNYARFNILALTGRAAAARPLLDGPGVADDNGMRAAFLDAVEQRRPDATEQARRTFVAIAEKNPPATNDAIMYLCALGEKEAAFEVTEGFLFWRGRFISANPANRRQVDTYNRRMTQWLFTPPVALMRADPRFAGLCNEFGLADYWRSRNVRPDYLRYGENLASSPIPNSRGSSGTARKLATRSSSANLSNRLRA